MRGGRAQGLRAISSCPDPYRPSAASARRAAAGLPAAVSTQPAAAAVAAPAAPRPAPSDWQPLLAGARSPSPALRDLPVPFGMPSRRHADCSRRFARSDLSKRRKPSSTRLKEKRPGGLLSATLGAFGTAGMLSGFGGLGGFGATWAAGGGSTAGAPEPDCASVGDAAHASRAAIANGNLRMTLSSHSGGGTYKPTTCVRPPEPARRIRS